MSDHGTWHVVTGIGNEPFAVAWDDDGHVTYKGISLEEEQALSAFSGEDRAVVRFASGLAVAIDHKYIGCADDLKHALNALAWYRSSRLEPDELHGPLQAWERSEAERAARVRRLAKLPPATQVILSHSRHEPTLRALLDVATAPEVATKQAEAGLQGSPLAPTRGPIRRRYFRSARTDVAPSADNAVHG